MNLMKLQSVELVNNKLSLMNGNIFDPDSKKDDCELAFTLVCSTNICR